VSDDDDVTFDAHARVTILIAQLDDRYRWRMRTPRPATALRQLVTAFAEEE
jgi:hypothetical protein